jgi:hypothetical protein
MLRRWGAAKEERQCRALCWESHLGRERLDWISDLALDAGLMGLRRKMASEHGLQRATGSGLCANRVQNRVTFVRASSWWIDSKT